MPKKRLLKILLPTLVLSLSFQAKSHTLSEAVAQTFSNSPDLFITTNIREQIDKELRGAYADYLPVVDVSGGWGRENSDNSTTRGAAGRDGSRTLTRTEFSVTANQMLFDGFAVYHNVDGNRHRVTAQSWRVNGTAQDLALQVADAYLDVLLRRHLVTIARDNLASHQRIYSQIQKRSEGGIGRKADLDQAAGRLAQAKTNSIAEEANLRDANIAYVRVVGAPAHGLVQPPIPHVFPASEKQAVEIGLKNNPIYKATFEDYEVTRAEHRVTRSPFSPRLDLELAATRNHNVDGVRGDNDENTALLRVRWNAFRGGKDVADLCRTAYKVQEAQEVRNRAYRQVVESVKLAWTNYDSAKKQLPHRKTHRDASANVVEAYHKQFNIGQRTLLDLLDAENESFGTKREYSLTRNTMVVGMHTVLQATGQLTDYLGVGMPREADPKPKGLFIGARPWFDASDTAFDGDQVY
jgi:adhesin transport system outer membrane protein